MKRCFLLLTLLCTLSAPLSVAHAKDDGHDKDRAFITRAVREMDTAANTKDVDWYVQYTAADFVTVDETGKTTTHGKAERRQKMIDLYARGASVSGHTMIASILFSRQGALVTESGTTTFTVNYNGQPMALTFHGIWRDVWVKSGSGWLEKRSTTVMVHRAEADKTF